MVISPGFPPSICRRLLALAERDPRRAVFFARRALGTFPPDEPRARAWAMYTLGWALLCWERVDAARPRLSSAHDLFAAGGVSPGTLRCRYALLLADQMQLVRPNLDGDFAALADQFAQAGMPPDAARVRLEQARYLNILGRPRDAEALLDQIAPLVDQADPLDRARLLRVQGIVANARSDYARATDLLAQAAHGFARLRNRRELAKCWLEQGWLALRQEQLDQALELYRRAERACARLDLPLQRAFCAKDLGLLMGMRGAYDLALQQTLAALRTFRAFRRSRDQAGCQLHIGNIYFYTGRWDAALACYTRAEAIYTAGGVIGFSLVARRNRAMVYRAKGRRAEAQALLAGLETDAEAIGNQGEVAEIWSIQAALLADDGWYDEAERRYQHARDLFARLRNMPAVGECMLEQGWLALRRGAVKEAESRFRAAAPALARHPHHRWRVDYGMARCVESRGEVDVALGYYRAASVTIAGLRQRLASEEISSSLYTRAAQLHVDALRLAAGSGAVETLVEIGEYQRALVLRRMLALHLAPLPAEYQAEHDTLRQQIVSLLSDSAGARDVHTGDLDSALTTYGELLLRARHSTHTGPGLSAEPPEVAFDLARVRARLDAAYDTDWTALVYMMSGDTLLIASVTPQELELQQIPYDASLRSMLHQASRPTYHSYTHRGFTHLQAPAAGLWDRLRPLADLLLPPAVRSRLHPMHRLLIIPAGPLHQLPWAALRLEQGWLAERAVVQILPSLAAWEALAARSPGRGSEALLVGCSVFGDRAPALPAVAAELTAVAERWPSTSAQLDNTQASRTALIKRSASGELGKYGLLHIASHAQLLPASGLAAHVKLWDGDLLLPEVVGLRLNGALVTLSACDGAAADALPGEEVLSLSWAWLAAGATGVLASLWPVYDQAVLRLMSLFYDALRQHGDAVLALAWAQRLLIAAHRADGDPTTGPSCWGSFILTGVGRVHW